MTAQLTAKSLAAGFNAAREAGFGRWLPDAVRVHPENWIRMAEEFGEQAHDPADYMCLIIAGVRVYSSPSTREGTCEAGQFGSYEMHQQRQQTWDDALKGLAHLRESAGEQFGGQWTNTIRSVERFLGRLKECDKP